MEKYVFGPVASRRLGISLGVDVLPYKTCTLDCIYCECGRTTDITLQRQHFVNPIIVLEQIEKVTSKHQHIDYITFSGAGEPTLNKDIGQIILGIKKLTHTPIAVLTNGTLLYDPKVRAEICNADLVIPSLDAVSSSIFSKINRPHPDLDIQNIIKGLIEFRNEFTGQIWLEVFIAQGINDNEEEIHNLYETIKSINPDRIQLNSLDRPPAFEGVKPVSIEKLENIKHQWKGLSVDIIKRIRHRQEISAFSRNLESNILNTIKRRPLTLEDLEIMTGKKRLEILKYIDVLEKEKKINPKIVEEKIFYWATENNQKVL